MTQIKDIARM